MNLCTYHAIETLSILFNFNLIDLTFGIYKSVITILKSKNTKLDFFPLNLQHTHLLQKNILDDVRMLFITLNMNIHSHCRNRNINVFLWDANLVWENL